MKPTRCVVVFAVCCISVLGLGPGQAWAGPPPVEHGVNVMRGYAFELGGIAHVNNSEYASSELGATPEVFGLVLRDRHGLTARMIAGILVAIGAGARAAGPKKIESRTYRSGNYRVTETKTTYHSQAEKDEISRNANKTISGLFGLPLAEFEFELYGRERFGFGDSVGYKMNILFGGGKRKDKIAWEFGFGWGNVDSRFSHNNMDYAIDHKYFGMPIRVMYATRLFVARLTWEWNWLAHGVEDEQRVPTLDTNDNITKMTIGHHPLHFDIQTAFFGRVYAQAGVTMVRKKKSATTPPPG